MSRTVQDRTGLSLGYAHASTHGRTPSAHDLAREYRVTKALAESAVPVARPLLLCEDERGIGAPFTVVEHVVRARGPHLPPVTTRSSPSHIARVETLVRSESPPGSLTS